MDKAQNNISRLQNFLYVLIATTSAILYGTVGYYGTLIINSNLTIYEMLFWRFFISLLILIFITHFLLKIRIRFNKGFCKQAFICTIFYTVSTAFCFHSSQEIGIGLSMCVFFIFPVFNIILAWISNKDSISKLVFISLILSCLGVYFISSSSESLNNYTGVLYALIAALSFALYLFLTQKLGIENTALESTFAIFIGNTLIFLLLSLSFGRVAIPSNITIWGNIFILSAMSTILPTILMIYALSRLGSTKVAVISVFDPVCALLIGSMFLSESLSIAQSIGISIIILSNLLIHADESTQHI